MSNQPPEIELLAGQKQSGESNKAIQACNDWLRLGSGRTLSRLLKKYHETPQITAPTSSLNTVQGWSKTYDWSGRATEYDAAWEERKNAERQRVMNDGLALDYRRVKKLFKLAAFLEQQMYEQDDDDVYHNIWMPDVKSIGSGEFAERVDIERFNAAIVEQFRKTLEDIAKEVGGRVAKTDLTSGGQPLNAPVIYLPSVDESADEQ